MTLRCSACHAAHHRGVLEITGEAPDHIVTKRVNASAHRAPVGAASAASERERTPSEAEPSGTREALVDAKQEPARNRFEEAALRTQVRDALVGLGWKIGIASAAVREARAHVGANATLEAWILEALRRCPLPRT